MLRSSPESLDATHHCTATRLVSLSFKKVSTFIRTRVAGHTMEKTLPPLHSPPPPTAFKPFCRRNDGHWAVAPLFSAVSEGVPDVSIVADSPTTADVFGFRSSLPSWLFAAAHENKRDRRDAASRGRALQEGAAPREPRQESNENGDRLSFPLRRRGCLSPRSRPSLPLRVCHDVRWLRFCAVVAVAVEEPECHTRGESVTTISVFTLGP